ARDRHGDLRDLRSDPRSGRAAPAHARLAGLRGTWGRAVTGRLLARASVLLVGAMLTACAGTGLTSSDLAPRRAAPAQDRRAEAYYEYAVAQIAAQSGRFTDAIPALREALKRDSSSAYLWMTLAQWLGRTDAADEALAAARRAVGVAPADDATQTTLAEILRTRNQLPQGVDELE